MKKRPVQEVQIAVLDREQLMDRLHGALADSQLPASTHVQLRSFESALDLMGEGAPRVVDGLALGVGSVGPFLSEVLRWGDQRFHQRTPTLIVGSGNDEQDDGAARQILGREHVQWLPPRPGPADLNAWVLKVVEVQAIRSRRTEHEQAAQQLRRLRMALFHGASPSMELPEDLPCGPPLPTSIAEVEPLKEARSRFERAHIQAVIRGFDSLKDASVALGISYTSLWRRLR